MQLGFSKRVAEILLDDLFSIILDELLLKKKIKIPKFGTFILHHKNQRIGRNPKTLEKKIISERNVVIFRPSKDLKNFINNNE